MVNESYLNKRLVLGRGTGSPPAGLEEDTHPHLRFLCCSWEPGSLSWLFPDLRREKQLFCFLAYVHLTQLSCLCNRNLSNPVSHSQGSNVSARYGESQEAGLHFPIASKVKGGQFHVQKNWESIFRYFRQNQHIMNIFPVPCTVLTPFASLIWFKLPVILCESMC